MRIKMLLIGIILSVALLLSLTASGRSAVIMRPNGEKEILTMSANTIRLVFTGRQRWINGQDLTIVLFDHDSNEHRMFVYEILGITTYQFDAQLNKQVYVGKIKPPIVVQSTREMIETIRKTPNSIGYVPSSSVLNKRSGVIVVDIVY